MAWSMTSRVVRSHEQARASYDRLSRWYDVFEEPFERHARRIGLRLLGPAPGERIIEIGFGTGHDLVALARAVGLEGLVCGVDLSPGMRRVAEGRVERAKVGARMDLQTADALALPYADGSFDAALMSFTLELFDTPEIPCVLAEIRRVVSPGGRLVVVALTRPTRAGLLVRLYERAHRWLPQLVDCRPIPLGAALVEAGLEVRARRAASLWGLPVETALAVVPG